jgi:hypothetical protein
VTCFRIAASLFPTLTYHGSPLWANRPVVSLVGSPILGLHEVRRWPSTACFPTAVMSRARCGSASSDRILHLKEWNSLGRVVRHGTPGRVMVDLVSLRYSRFDWSVPLHQIDWYLWRSDHLTTQGIWLGGSGARWTRTPSSRNRTGECVNSRGSDTSECPRREPRHSVSMGMDDFGCCSLPEHGVVLAAYERLHSPGGPHLPKLSAVNIRFVSLASAATGFMSV